MTYDFNNGGGDAYLDLTTFDTRNRAAYQTYSTATTHSSPSAASNIMPQDARHWAVPLDMSSNNSHGYASMSPEEHQSSPPSQSASPHSQHSPLQQSPFQQSVNPLTDWALQQQQQQQQQQHLAAADMTQFIQDAALMSFNAFPANFQPTNPLDYLPATTQAALQANLLESTFNGLPMDDHTQAVWPNTGMGDWQEFQNTLQMDGLPRLDSVGSNSPTEPIPIHPMALIPWSLEASKRLRLSLTLLSLPSLTAMSMLVTTATASATMATITTTLTLTHIPMSLSLPTLSLPPLSPPSLSSLNPLRAVIAPAVVPDLSPHLLAALPAETRVLVRAPLLRALLRMLFDVFPMARRMVPLRRRLAAERDLFYLSRESRLVRSENCELVSDANSSRRLAIRDIGYFMKDWKADYERHMDRGVSVYNVKGFAQKETLMWITHGYGFALPVMVREVFVADDSCFSVDWVESTLTDQEPIDFETRTEKLDVGAEGIRLDALSEYLDKHIDGPFEDFIDDHFEGTPFITEILKTAHRYYVKEKMPVIRKSLKLVLAYNLTMHITMVENQGSEVDLDGQIDDEDSKYYGRTVAPVMINFQIKCALADMWRELQKDILEELSALYSGVYSGEKMKNWPTIFMIASILLAVWEEMQFDCHYRVPDPVAVNKFCTDMETTPVGVIVGLFHAISQKLPAFTDWDTRKHGHLLHNNTSVCEAMTEVRQHVIKHGMYTLTVLFIYRVLTTITEAYLRTRKESKFDRYDFDSLSNKFLSKLVIRAN
ncbi:hypothetical protein HZ326_0944 [Fusarium oxysporum f. sp. albedinis]|nr:hypothetical protein HZ326_0944 [Fusarium oxysporum f. sp. albedinis]